MRTIYLLPFLAAFFFTPSTNAEMVVEDWQFNDANGTQFSGLANDAGSATFTGDVSQVTTNGAGALSFSQGADASDNVFRNALLTSPNQSTGIFELEFLITSAQLTGGDATGANVGFGFRDETTNSDLFLARLHKQSDTLRLQTRINGTNTNVVNFGTDALTDSLNVRARANLDSGTLNLFYTIGAGAEQNGGTFALATGEFDQVRMLANTNSTDWGAADFIDVDFLTITAVPEPTSACLFSIGLIAMASRRRK